MIYCQQSFDLHPASPATRDRFVAAATELLLPANEDLGARLVGAWFCNEEWFSRIVHVTELDDLAAFDAYRAALAKDPAASKADRALGELSQARRTELLEPLGPVDVGALHAAIDRAAEKPAQTHTFAILEVTPGRMDDFCRMLGAAAGNLPIIASWRDVAGNPDRVIDLWEGDMGKQGYRPTNDAQNAFFEPLRELAPREKMVRLHPLPYSPLR